MRRKRILLFAMCLVLMLQMGALVSAAAHEREPKVVRVGWYESAFHRTDSFGRKSGYGYEYQQRVAIYTGWTYEYVEGSWSELFEMLVAGEIDLLSDVSWTEARAEQILYSAEEMGSEDFHAFIAPANTEIRPDNFETFNGKKVGVNKNSIQESMFIEWAKNHNVTPEIVELTGKTPELIEMLANGEIDVLVTLDTYGRRADMIPVCKIGSASSYFGINKNRPDLKQDLDVAMNRLLEENRDFNQQMSEKYHAAGSVSSFLTPDETEWLADHGTIRVGYRDDSIPYSERDDRTGRLTGTLADYLLFAATGEKNAQLRFETVAFATVDDALQALEAGEVDCVFPVNFSAYDAEQRGLFITDPLVSTEMFVAVRTADQVGVSPDRQMTVAVLEEHLNHETFLMDYFPNWEIRYYKSNEDSFRAVGTGEADCTLVSNYRINRVIGLCNRYKLATLATGKDMGLAFATRRDDNCLYSILNKLIRLMPETAVNASLTGHSVREEKTTVMGFVKDHLSFFIAAVCIVVAAILLLVLRNMNTQAKVREGSRIISEAERDALTGLYNRNFFLVYADRQRREHPDKPMDAVVLNIERFHSLNTLNGRDFGDEVLKALGGEISDFVAEGDGLAARTSGDRFEIYCAHREDYPEVLNRIHAGTNAKLSREADVQIRMGVMPWRQDLTPAQMLDRAWTACRIIRGDFKSRIMVYDEEMQAQDERDQKLRDELTRALEEHELEVYYQPKFAIQSDPPQLRGAEALVRWNHPQLGLLSPADFIPLFERSGQIGMVDGYVWEQAAAQVAAWREKTGKTLPVSINLSRLDIFDANLAATLERIVTEHGLNRGDLLLEITESAYTENADHLIRVIGGLREKGFVVEMDDFGSGYSSLNMLSSIPLDILKMDIAFIRNIERDERDLRMVELIMDIARTLKVPVVAEGVETEKQLQLLKDAGCDLVQGYYFSNPLPADAFEREILKL